MKRGSLIAAATVVLVANALALLHAWRNRSGPVDATIRLTDRELPRSYRTNDDDSGVALTLRRNPPLFGFRYSQVPWLDREMLGQLGFDVTVAPSDDRAPEFYQRQLPRQIFVALENNGPAWVNWLAQFHKEIQERPFRGATSEEEQAKDASRLIAIDADTSASRLRTRHPDRSFVLIVPAVIRIEAAALYSPGQGRDRTQRQIAGFIQDIPSSLHVPRPFSEVFRRMPARNTAHYQIDLQYGSALEPWIVGMKVEPLSVP